MDSVQPDVLVLDIAMPHLNGMEAARQIVVKHPGIAVVILSMLPDETCGCPAGPQGSVCARTCSRIPRSRIRLGHQGGSCGKAYFSPAVGKTLLEDYVRQLQQRNEEDS